MGVDPEGTWNWDHFWKILGAIALVALITVATVFTAGIAATVVGASAGVVAGIMEGVAIGAAITGTMEIVGQCINKGIDQLDLKSVAIETFTGGLFGGFYGLGIKATSAVMRVVASVGKVLVSGLNAALHGATDPNLTNEEIKKNVLTSMKISIAFQIVGLRFGLRSGYNQAFGLKAGFTLGAISAGKNLWRNFKNEIVEFATYIGEKIWEFLKRFAQVWWKPLVR